MRVTDAPVDSSPMGEYIMTRSRIWILLGLSLLCVAVGGFLSAPRVYEGAAASQPTPVPLPFPPKIPVEQVAHQDTHMVHDLLAPLALDALTDKPCVNGRAADTYPCSNVDLDAFLPLSEIGGGHASSSWGWTDPDTHHEYALVGRSTGTSFVDITNPKAPVYLGNLPSHTGESWWRELKTYGYYAFVVSDQNGAHGMQIFDLRQLRAVTNPPVTFSETAHYAGFDNGHTITLNPETGYVYVNGSNTCNGGPHIVDVRDPLHPKYAGCFASSGYTHDSQCVTYHGPDAAYANHEICFDSNQTTLSILDVTDKSQLTQLARTSYVDFGYIHQGWLTPDQSYFVLDDELDEMDYAHTAFTYIWDVRDLNDPRVINIYRARFRAIDHNQYFVGDRIYQADYRAGLRVLDATNVASGKLREVGYFDIFPQDDSPEFNGAWNVYPFHSNGVVSISGIEEGLFIVQPKPEPNPPPCPKAPTRADLVSPAPDATVPTRRVALSWDAKPCASDYKVIVRQVTGQGEIVRQRASTTGTQFKTTRLDPGGTYRWTIRSCNAWGCAKGSSRSFTIQ